MKSKKSGSNPLAELNFVASVDLDHAMDLLAQLDDEDYDVIFTERNPDRIDFKITYPLGVWNGAVQGTLQRWQGTDTRITCTGEAARYSQSEAMDKSSFVGCMIAGVVGGLFLSLAGLLFRSGELALVGVFAMLTPMLMFSGFSTTSSRYELPEPVFRERDAVLDKIIAAFKNAGEVKAL